MLTSTLTASKQSEFAMQVRDGLIRPGQKELPSKYLYDDIGSALFELICKLPEYGLTRAEERILSRHASEIVDRLPKPIAVAELGSGTGKKTRLILEALCRRHTVSYYPIEISSAALACCERELHDMRSLTIVGLEREYLDGLLEVAARRAEDQRLLVLFLGSTIGNFGDDASTKFLKQLRDILWDGDFLLLGADLQKPVGSLLAAYDDPLGITAAFNRNLLVRVNRELGADFAIDQFAHHLIFDEQTHSIEMHLRARSQQIVSIPAADITVKFARDETIWTETCHKFSLPELQRIAHDAGFRSAGSWLDADWPFTEQLWQSA